MVAMSNIAHIVDVIENSYKAWDEEHGIENAGEREEQEVYQQTTEDGQDKIHQSSGEDKTVQVEY